MLKSHDERKEQHFNVVIALFKVSFSHLRHNASIVDARQFRVETAKWPEIASHKCEIIL